MTGRLASAYYGDYECCEIDEKRSVFLWRKVATTVPVPHLSHIGINEFRVTYWKPRWYVRRWLRVSFVDRITTLPTPRCHFRFWRWLWQKF